MNYMYFGSKPFKLPFPIGSPKHYWLSYKKLIFFIKLDKVDSNYAMTNLIGKFNLDYSPDILV